MLKDLRDYRETYDLHELIESQVHPNPFFQFNFWFDEYQAACKSEVNIMTLVTMSSIGPTARVVLLKQLEDEGFVFYTNYESNKAKELEHDPRAGLNFFWPELQRQVRVQGMIEKVSERDSDVYFASRPRESQIGAWVSPQSQVIENRSVLENRLQELNEEFKDKEVPRPDHWGGFRLKPQTFEFWQGRPSRLHDRIEYFIEEDNWKLRRLAP
jgi:pyridoxamine 5'-phosphate oxidase